MSESIRYWAIRTDRENLVFINSELRDGRLRQGWGSTPQEDLNFISDAMKRNEALSDAQRLCWRGNRKLLPTEGVRKGDIIILPNLPEIGKWLIARAVDDQYEYSVDPKEGDYGHIRHVELVGDKPVNPYNGKVAAPLRTTMACRSRMWNIDWASKYIDTLVKSLEEGKDHSKASTESNRLDEIYSSTLTQLRQALVNNFHGKEIEPVVQKVLAKVYGVEEEMIDNKRGRADRGADLICRFIDPLGLEHNIAVQVKMGGGQYSWEKAFNQIDRVASGEDHITGAVIMDIDEKPNDIEERRADLEAKLNIPISLIAGNDFAKLILTNFPRLSMEILVSDS